MSAIEQRVEWMEAAPQAASLDELLIDVRACRRCEPHLPLGPRPVVQAAAQARILIVGQAPGARVHASGIPWNDASGARLRDWMGIDPVSFYDETLCAIVPMGFCYPGCGKQGDNPPRPECAPLWFDRIRQRLPAIQLTLLIGQYAQRYLLDFPRKQSLTETVQAWRDLAPAIIPLPHPSPRNLAWFKRNPWFDGEVVPVLQREVKTICRIVEN